MTKEEYNQKALDAIYDIEKNHMEYMMDIEEKFRQCRELLPVLNKYGEKIKHDIFNAWSSVSIIYTMDKDDDWSILRVLWQLIEDIDEIVELKWTVNNMNTKDLSVKASGYTDNPYFSIEITIKKAVVKC